MANNETSSTTSILVKKIIDSITPNLETYADFSKTNLSIPYFTHHSDHWGFVLISKPLNGDNYSTWKKAMTPALNSKNKLSFVNGLIRAPSEEIDSEGYAAWSWCNDMFHSWIVNTLVLRFQTVWSTALLVMKFGKIFMIDSLKTMHLAYLRFREITLVFDKNNSMSLPITQNWRACGMN